MTNAEHADRVHRTLKAMERAVRAHHQALAEWAKEHGESLSASDTVMTAAAAPKIKPDNE